MLHIDYRCTRTRYSLAACWSFNRFAVCTFKNVEIGMKLGALCFESWMTGFDLKKAIPISVPPIFKSSDRSGNFYARTITIKSCWSWVGLGFFPELLCFPAADFLLQGQNPSNIFRDEFEQEFTELDFFLCIAFLAQNISFFLLLPISVI